MNANGYLMRLARTAIIRDEEKASINKSLGRLRLLLRRHFKREVESFFPFGSFTRQTILPRRLDERSDVDFMVVFPDDGVRPQTYLDRLRRFVEAQYARSEIRQSHPTIQLSLNHITFELVPATKSFWGEYQIPSKDSNFQDWQSTDPNGFNERLSKVNQENRSLVKPLVRTLKYWNANAGYPFDSYALETHIVDSISGSYFFFNHPETISIYFHDYVQEGIDGMLDLWGAKWKREAVDRLQGVSSEVIRAERDMRSDSAVRALTGILPPLWPLPRSTLLG